MSPKHVASCSFGKDSIATILLALEHGEPLDEAVYCEVMFDDATSGEVPEHQAFIYQAAIPALEKLGVPVRVLRSEKTYTSVFMGKVTRGPKKGMIRSFPVCGKCYVQRDCKMHPIRQYQKTLPSNTVQYIGIAKNEPQRLARLGGNQVSLLEKYGYTEDDAKQLCKQEGLLSPVYEFTDRGGCWFCPNAKLSELRHLYDHHPDLWQKMMRLQIVPGKVTEKFNRSQTFADIDAMFREWDLQTAAYDRRYHQQWPAQNSRGAGGTVQDRHAHFSSGAGTGRPARRRGKAPCPAAGAQRKIRRKALHPCEAENAVRSRHQICEERPETERGKGAVT